MCVIIKGRLKHIRGNVDLTNAWRTNPHGVGIVVPHKVEPVMIKGIMTLERLRAVLARLVEAHGKEQEIVIHFRMATHGSINQANTHPFRVSDHSWLMHNGVLSGLGTHGEKGSSDSAHLARILSRLTHSDRVALLGALPGRYAYVDRDEILLFGDFVRDGKVMCSNTYFKPMKITASAANSWAFTRDGKGWKKLEINEPNYSSLLALPASYETTIEDTLAEGSEDFYMRINGAI